MIWGNTTISGNFISIVHIL